MATVIANDGNPALGVPIGAFTSIIGPRLDSTAVVLPSGALRIGGDSPSGLVLSGGGPAQRTVRLFDRETGTLVAITTSGVDGTYTFTGLSARTEGYDIQIMGNSVERDIIVPRVHPG